MTNPPNAPTGRLLPNAIVVGDAREQTARIEPETVDLALWSPPYLMGKPYESDLDLQKWTALMQDLLALHATVLRPGAFAVVNISDLRTWPDPTLPPGPYAEVRGRQEKVSAADVAAAQREHPEANEKEIAHLLGCSPQTVGRRKRGSAHRAGRRPPTRVLRTSTIIEQAATRAGLYLFDHRIWSKTPAWQNNAWTASSYRAVDKWEHLLFLHKPGPFVHDRTRLDHYEWAEWGSRGIWTIPSVSQNDDNAPRFPDELAARIVRMLTEAEQLVLDPFVGTGTTTAMAELLGRRWIGIDINPQNAETALDRTLKQSPAGAAPRPTTSDRRLVH